MQTAFIYLKAVFLFKKRVTKSIEITIFARNFLNLVNTQLCQQ